MSRSNIEWTQDTWNPIVGCSIVSPGCTNCYAMKMAARIEGMNAEALASGRKPTGPHYDGTTHSVNGNNVWTGKLARASAKTLTEPLRNRKPTVYFVNSMSDLFHESVPDEWIDEVFAVMAASPQHTFQVLTKRSARMRKYMLQTELPARWRRAARTLARPCLLTEERQGSEPDHRAGTPWPLPNVWLGVSTERQKEADERIPDLLATPAAVRFISAEPLLGPIDLMNLHWKEAGLGIDAVRGRIFGAGTSISADGKLDWVIVGGESGPGSRPMHPDWARALRDQCLAAGVPFFFKQWGNWYPIIDRDKEGWDKAPLRSDRDCEKYRILNFAGGQGFHGERVHLMQRYGKKQAGRELDGVRHDETPEAAPHRVIAPARRLDQIAFEALNRPLAGAK